MVTSGNESQVQQTEQAQPTRLEVPKVVRVYGMIIMVVNAIGMGLAVIAGLLNLAQGGVFALIGGALQFLIALVLYRLGKGLKEGERSAVYGICILGGLAVLGGFGLMSASVVSGVLLLGFVAVFYVPPIISAFGHWDAFK
jgi:hypothetical protein